MRDVRSRRTDSGGDGRARTSTGRRRVRGEKGYVLVMVGLLIVPLIAFTAFAVDLGSWYAQGSRMQRTADAAALAGVVWAGDPINLTKWDTVARDTATRNGFIYGVGGVTVTTAKVTAIRIRVTISSNGKQYFSKLFVPGGERLSRTAAAEYNLPVPLGSPRNYLGTGTLGGTAASVPDVYKREYLYVATSGYCTGKQQGDRIATKQFDDCSGAANAEYSATNYLYYVELPAARAQAVDVIIYDGAWHDSGTAAADSNGCNLCPTMGAPDFTFSLYQADGTVLDDGDNPTMASVNGCADTTAGINGTKVFADQAGAGGDGNYTFNPSTATNFQSSSNWWKLCRIPTTAPAGRYLLRVSNGGTSLRGSNAYSIVATPATTQKLCDQRSDATCPRVYSKDFLSVRAGEGGTAQFYLAEIGPEHVGKKMKIELWDPAEGALELRIQKPLTATTWSYGSFSWTDDRAVPNTGSNVTTIPVSAYDFNGRLLTITVDLTGYSPPAGNNWWRIEYKYGGTPSDRSTWAVQILGDPVHLVE